MRARIDDVNLASRREMAREAGRLPQHLYCSRILYDRAEKEDAHFHAKSQVSACFKASSSASDATTTSRIQPCTTVQVPQKIRNRRKGRGAQLLIKERLSRGAAGLHDAAG